MSWLSRRRERRDAAERAEIKRLQYIYYGSDPDREAKGQADLDRTTRGERIEDVMAERLEATIRGGLYDP